MNDMPPTMRLLMSRVLWDFIFVATCPDSVLDPDTACSQMEAIAATLQQMGPADRDAFMTVAREERAKTKDPRVQQFIDELPGSVW